MIIPLPCKLGENYITEKGIQRLTAVNWFKWSRGMEYTYFFQELNKNVWSTNHFEAFIEPNFDISCEINDSLIQNGFLKGKGFPIKGRGYAYGYKLISDELFVELILTDKYLAHIYVQCNENGDYVEGGRVIVPPSWDTEEKQKSIILSQYSNTPVYACFP